MRFIKRSDAWTRENTLVHEAGHAVAAHLLAWEIQHMQVQWTNDREHPSCVSLVPKVWASNDEWREITRSSITIGMAGAAAEVLVLGELYLPGIEGDLDLILRESGMRLTILRTMRITDKLMAGAKGKTAVELGYHRALDLLQPHVGAISGLAATLQDECELPGHRVHEIIAAALK